MDLSPPPPPHPSLLHDTCVTAGISSACMACLGQDIQYCIVIPALAAARPINISHSLPWNTSRSNPLIPRNWADIQSWNKVYKDNRWFNLWWLLDHFPDRKMSLLAVWYKIGAEVKEFSIISAYFESSNADIWFIWRWQTLDLSDVDIHWVYLTLAGIGFIWRWHILSLSDVGIHRVYLTLALTRVLLKSKVICFLWSASWIKHKSFNDMSFTSKECFWIADHHKSSA